VSFGYVLRGFLGKQQGNGAKVMA